MRVLALVLVASPVLAQGHSPDLRGTWTLDAAKSHSSQSLPVGRTLVIDRAANVDPVEQQLVYDRKR
jgi:hypothetical protein